MKYLVIITLLIMAFACRKEEKEIDTTLPTCIEIILEDTTAYDKIKTVQVQSNDGELHYWLNTDARHVDGAEYIVNSSCDTICSFCGECFPPNCIDDYDRDDWVIIWE